MPRSSWIDAIIPSDVLLNFNIIMRESATGFQIRSGVKLKNACVNVEGQPECILVKTYSYGVVIIAFRT